MESSLNSSQTEPRISKTIFKKPLPRANASFDVSLNESTTVEPQIDKTDVDLDFTSVPKKTGPFKKDKKPIQQFNVTVEESLTESDHEKTVANQKFLFRHKNKPEVDFFNVSECESKLTVTQIDSLIESNTSNEKESVILHNKSNPFRKSKRTQKEKLTTENDQGTFIDDENMSDTVNKSSNQTNVTIDNSDTTISNLTNRKSLFKVKKKSRVSNIENLMEVTSTEDDVDKSLVTKTNIFKSNLFKKQNTSDQMMEISSSDELTLVGNQPSNESFTPQETQSNSLRSSSRLSAKDLTPLNKSSSDNQELRSNEKSISFDADNAETNNSMFSKNNQTPLSKTNDSKSRTSTDSNNLSGEGIDPNISTSSKTSGKRQSILSQSNGENQDSNVNNSISSKKSKRGSLRESTKRSRTEKSFNMSIGDNIGGTSKSSAHNFTEDTEKNRNLSTTETTKRNLSFDKNLSKITNKSLASEMTFEQSSYNDDNLNNWMSDHSDLSNHSDVENPQINIPPIPTEIEPQKETVEKSEKSQETSVLVSWEEKYNEIVSNAKKLSTFQPNNKLNLEVEKKQTKPKVTSSLKKNTYKPPKLKKPAPFATKNLYQFLIKKLKSKYGIDCIIQAEQLVLAICDTVKKVTRRKDIQKDLIQDLKIKMAKAGIIETTLDFYEFVIRFLPYDFRVKVVPCFQPVTNTVYPPKDTRNPFEKIL